MHWKKITGFNIIQQQYKIVENSLNFLQFMYTLKRKNLTDSLSPKAQNRRFMRQKENSHQNQLYSVGVQAIIQKRRILELENDTLLMAIDIFRGFISKQDGINEQKLISACIASLILASKINDIYPITVEETADAFEYFDGKEEIMEMESYMLKQCDFMIPFESNLVSYFQRMFSAGKEDKIEQAIRITLKCISDPYFANLPNQTLGRAVIQVLSDNCSEMRNNMSKTVAATVKLIKIKLQPKILKSKNFNLN